MDEKSGASWMKLNEKFMIEQIDLIIVKAGLS